MKQPVKTDASRKKALVCVGSNVTSRWGNPRDTVTEAGKVLSSHLKCELEMSGLYQTPAFPAGSGQDFVNGAFAFESRLEAGEILAILHQVEALADRERDVRWGARTLDLDLIALDQIVAPDELTWLDWANLPLDAQITAAPQQLILPHPRAHERSFALVPLCDLAPNWRHPILDKTLKQLLDALPPSDVETVKAL